jgi:outer membrane protein assembly factor BamB
MSSINKNIAIATALILVLVMSSALAVLPIAKAIGTPWPYSYTPTKGANGLWNEPTFAGLTVSPDPVGVGQPVQVIMIIELLPPSTGIEAVTGTYGGWLGMMLTITDPNGTKTTMGPYESDVSGTYQISFTPTMVGTWTFQFSFPGQTVNGTGFGNYYANFLASTSDAVSLTVQSAPLTGYAEAPVPLPDQYFTFPINGQNRAWNTISGPWLMPSGFGFGGYNTTGAFNPYTYAPASAHIAWKEQLYAMTAGLAGGDYGSLQSPGTENALTSGFSSPIIMEGRMFYNGPIVPYPNGTEQPYFYCADIATGKVLWQVPGSITCGQILDWRTQQMHSALPYLWSITSGDYKMYSAVNGELQAHWYNLPAGTLVANSTTVPAVFGGVIFTPTKINHAINVLYGVLGVGIPGAPAIVLEKPNPLWIGQNIGGGGGGGALLVYILSSTPGSPTAWLACWNSTLAIDSICNDPVDWPPGDSQGGFNSGIGSGMGAYWPTIALQDTTMPLDWEWGIMWNITIPNPTYMSRFMGFVMPATWSPLGFDGDYVVLTSSTSNAVDSGTESFLMAAVNVASQPETTTWTVDVGGDVQHPTAGTFAWEDNITLPAYDQTFGGGALLNNGIIVFADGSTLSLTAYSEHTGAFLWSCNPFNNDFSMQAVSAGVVAYGMLYNAGYDGYMHAINITTGVQEWDSISRPGGLEMPEPAYPFSGCVVAGNEVFSSTSKGYEVQPLYRGHCLYAYNAQTGAQNWNISGEMQGIVVACGYLICANTYDGCVYAFHAGPTATTVTAPMTAVTVGSNCVIEGTVTDQTPGTLQGTPAISDAWMTPWMEYMFMDQPYPSGATGVPVSLDAVDPNNNFVHIGNATSDVTGAFGYVWTPPNVPGKYTIIATFAGSNSYYASSGEATAVVSQAVAPAPAPTYPVPYDYTMTIIAGVIAIIIAVAIGVLILYRKKP